MNMLPVSVLMQMLHVSVLMHMLHVSVLMQTHGLQVWIDDLRSLCPQLLQCQASPRPLRDA